MEKVVHDYMDYVGEKDRDKVLDAILGISRHEDVVRSHETWESYDQQWKDATKYDMSENDVIKYAALTRESMDAKNAVHDAAATLACKIVEESGILIDYDEDVLNQATVIGGVPELSAAWHNLRRGGIGGSTVSKILGFHWKSRNGYPVMMSNDERREMITDIAIEKMTHVTHAHPPTSGVLYRGHMWEPVSLAWLSVTHDIDIAVSKKTWNGVHPLQVINVDGIIVDDNGVPEGIVECKTSSRKWTWQWGVPVHYRAQVLWYLNATGLDYAHVVVRFDSGEFDVYTIYADETVDGTWQTERIDSDEYTDIISDTWESIQHYMSHLPMLWKDSPRLHAERKSVHAYVSEDDEGLFVNDAFFDIIDDDNFVIAQVETSAPYERMDESLTVPVSLTVNGDTVAVSGATYPLYPVDVAEDNSIKPEDIPDSFGDCVIFAQNTETYDYLKREFPSMDVINISALMRIDACEPGLSDFSSYEDVLEWLDSFFDDDSE